MPFYRKKKPVGATDYLEQVGMLLDDVAKWNAWRAEHPEPLKKLERQLGIKSI